MGSGIRKTCHNCFSTKDYDPKKQYCRKCGWKPETNKDNKLAKWVEK